MNLQIPVKFWKKLGSCALVSLFIGVGSLAARANDDGQSLDLDGGIPIASALITPGSYKAANPTYFQNVKVKLWFNKTFLEGTLYYGGMPFNFSTEVKADTSGQDAFIATGSFTQTWSNGVTCSIPMSIEIQRDNGKLYMRSNTPASILTQAPAGGPQCILYNNYVWTFHNNPYVMIAP